MATPSTHADHVTQQFGDQAAAYLSSAVHAQGKDLRRLAELLADAPQARLLDIGCGAGHASFVAAGAVAEVTAYDLSEQMLAVVEQAARDRQLGNIRVAQGAAESLPFADGAFDVVISRYSAHHWHDVGQALREVRRVLKPGGRAIFMDMASPGQPVLDIHLQTIEVLRDTSHVRNYAPGEWLAMFNAAGLTVERVARDRLALEFSSWIARMRTPEHFVTAIRALQQGASAEVAAYFAIQPDGSFSSDTLMIEAHRPA
ncbi:class I SAM-dependent methyltransferase [Nissabacter sp. SGAir0207]|uniref:class I SAM-dependent methyltransferase n=1 Tax=Nissabacter sp. SGAir0207 TaxID=2126321 RepID=UPI0010CD3E26|nr:class I SAM-dependent methyltransferase [Nissabacter sp. SGAir0207]QCR36953.1 SAM-dependent methyltransferase [Nissabacter sp. SGAir0207]